jgi:hypothetical protein
MIIDDKSKRMKAILDAMQVMPTKGGARPNAGRPLSTNPAKQRSMRFNDTHWNKLKELGGAKWVIEKLNEVK